jgi:hypothetical protein
LEFLIKSAQKQAQPGVPNLIAQNPFPDTELSALKADLS